MDAKLLQIRRSHASARPTSRNPAWQHTHNDLTYVLARLDAERERSERLRQALLKCKTCALLTEVRDLVSAVLRA